MKKESLTTIIYHDPCMDGFGAAFIAWLYNYDYEFIGAKPGDSPPDVTGPNRSVLVVDISWSRAQMEQMYAQTNGNMLVLDHHKTAENELKGLPYAHFDMNKSGIMLAWDFFFPELAIPDFLRYIGLRDLWKHENNPEAVAFTAAFNAPFIFWKWNAYFTSGDLVRETITKGYALVEYKQSIIQGYAEKAIAVDWNVNGTVYHTYVANVGYPWISDLGAYLCTRDPQSIVLLWTKDVNNPVISYSLRSSPEVDISVVAVHFGGGGHRTSAGFRSTLYPEQLIGN